ncbi:glycosyltransferase family 4 protein [Aquisalibacillus elongatus]|uniref:Glycosyltransferase involved in cell wall biosynthesis n=1 Tax=Aquisalibacillus elongatus TaxID=485577 RepID=A0A3N5BB85_9BACI|nr:glycosyltransferase family 4 protein [Aquisalibacillus elongatus]RPF54209.1 glycosyltransferase involved in cell wall biosynthesis [Aquisalibacillus elongatus]
MNLWIFNHHAGESGRHPSFSYYLNKKGVNVTLFSSSFIHNSYTEIKEYNSLEYFKTEEKDGYKRVYIKTPRYHNNGAKRLWNQIMFAYRSFKASKVLLKNKDKPEVIVGSSVHLFTGLSAYYLSRKVGSKFVFEIRDVWPQTLVDLGALKEKSLVTKIFRSIEKFLYNKADKIISVLPHGYRHISKYGISRDKVIYIPNGIDLKSSNKKVGFLAEEPKSFFESNSKKFIITFTGAHGLANGLKTVVRAASELEKMEENKHIKSHILLVGDGPEKNNLIELAKQLNLKNITFLNKVNKDQVPHILQHSDVCLFHLKSTPVFKYGLSSNKLFDYMNSGKPMIFAADTSYDFAEEAQNGISIPAESPKQIAESILELKRKMPEELYEMGQNGKKFVTSKHDLEKLADGVLEVCETITRK